MAPKDDESNSKELRMKRSKKTALKIKEVTKPVNNKPKIGMKTKNRDNIISKESKKALEQGNGKASCATHGNGCRHFGILDLNSMESTTFKYYSKNNRW